MSPFVRFLAVCFVSWSAASADAAEELSVRFENGRTVQGSLVEEKTTRQELCLEVRSTAGVVRCVIPWSQVSEVNVLASVPPSRSQAKRTSPKYAVIERDESILNSTANEGRLSELLMRSEPFASRGGMDYDSLRVSLRGIDDAGHATPLFGTIRFQLWGRRQEILRLNHNETTAVPHGPAELIATWTERLEATPTQRRTPSTELRVAPANQAQPRWIVAHESSDAVRLTLPLPTPLPAHDPERFALGELTAELLMPGVGVFNTSAADVALVRQSSLRDSQLLLTRSRFFPGESTTGSRRQYGDTTMNSQRRALRLNP